MRGPERNKILFDIELPSDYRNKLDKFLNDLENSEKIEITEHPIPLKRVEELVKEGFGLLDSMIIVQADQSEVDYFVTRDGVVERINSKRPRWLKIKATSAKGMLGILGYKKS